MDLRQELKAVGEEIERGAKKYRVALNLEKELYDKLIRCAKGLKLRPSRFAHAIISHAIKTLEEETKNTIKKKAPLRGAPELLYYISEKNNT